MSGQVIFTEDWTDYTMHHKMRNSCEPVCCRKICKESYVSDDLRDNWTLIAGEDGNSFMVGSAGRSIETSTRDIHFYRPRKSFFLQWHQLCNNFWFWPIKTVGCRPMSFFTAWLARNFRMSSRASRNSMKGSMIWWISGSGSAAVWRCRAYLARRRLCKRN